MTEKKKRNITVPALELETSGGDKILYSDKSVRQLAFNDTSKYDK